MDLSQFQGRPPREPKLLDDDVIGDKHVRLAAQAVHAAYAAAVAAFEAWRAAHERVPGLRSEIVNSERYRRDQDKAFALWGHIYLRDDRWLARERELLAPVHAAHAETMACKQEYEARLAELEAAHRSYLDAGKLAEAWRAKFGAEYAVAVAERDAAQEKLESLADVGQFLGVGG
jgi:hypothetical protein